MMTRSELAALIRIAFGGMVAEELYFGEPSSGVASDLQAATNTACQMVGACGMGQTLISAAAIQTPGLGNLAARVLASDAGRDEVEEVLGTAKADVVKLLAEHGHVVEALRDALLERDELVGDEIAHVILDALAKDPLIATA